MPSRWCSAVLQTISLTISPVRETCLSVPFPKYWFFFSVLFLSFLFRMGIYPTSPPLLLNLHHAVISAGPFKVGGVLSSLHFLEFPCPLRRFLPFPTKSSFLPTNNPPLPAPPQTQRTVLLPPPSPFPSGRSRTFRKSYPFFFFFLVLTLSSAGQLLTFFFSHFLF